MTSFLLYVLKVNIALGIFYCFYAMFLKSETFYSWNRVYFIVAALVAFLFPVVDFAFLFSTNKSLMYIKAFIPEMEVNVSGAEHVFSFSDIVSITIVTGACFLFLRLCFQLVSLFSLYSQSTKGILCAYNVALINNKVNPFSFFRCIFINPELYGSEDVLEILEHERIHAHQVHTIDILLYELVSAFCWYNPLVWFMKKEVKQNLEFLTDKEVLKAGYDKRHYQYNLLKVSRIPVYSGIVNNFNHLKNRIMMMNKKQSARVKLMKFALIIPVFAGMVFTANATGKINPISNSAVTETVAATGNAIVFDKTVNDFGTIKENGGKVSTVFTFVNEGTTPVVIIDVKASCGCTTPEWTKEPVAPGAKGHIKATYDPLNRIGAFDKTITVSSNTEPAQTTLKIKGEVVK